MSGLARSLALTRWARACRASGAGVAMDDVATHIRELESVVAKLGQVVVDQQRQIERLQADVSDVMTDNAIASLTPWPRVR